MGAGTNAKRDAMAVRAATGLAVGHDAVRRVGGWAAGGMAVRGQRVGRGDRDRPVLEHRQRVPAVPGFMVPRPALVSRVLSTPPGGLCLVQAPTGWGGTVLLAEVARASPAIAVWVSGRPHDPDPVAFWLDLLAALSERGVPTETTREALARADDDRADVVTTLLNTMAGQPEVLILVDDLDGLAHEPILRDLQLMIDALPSTVRLALRMEHGAYLDVRRLASSGRLVMLRADDLAFDDDQARQLVGLAAPDLDPARVQALLTLAEGWPAALALPFVTADREQDIDPAGWLLDNGLEMLVGSVWEALPAEDQRFLATVTVLDVLSADGCSALTQEDTHETADRLRRLDAWGLLRRLGNVPSQFAQRRLVAEYARRMLADKGRAEGARLHRLASEHLAQSGDVESAIAHALDAGDMPWVLVLLQGTVGEFLETGRASTVRALYSTSAEPLVAADHLHLLGAAWAEILAGNLAGAQRWLSRLVAAVAELPTPMTADPAAEPDGEFTQGLESQSTWLRAETLFLQARVAEWQGRPALARDFADRAVRMFGGRWARMVHQGAVMQAIRMRLWLDDRDAAHSMLVRASARPGTREYFRRVALPALRACLASEEGRAYRARHLAEQSIDASAVLGPLGQFDDADARLARSRACVDLDDPDAAAADAELLLAQAEAVGHVTYRILAMLALARAQAGQGVAMDAIGTCEGARAVLRAEAPGSELLLVVDRTELSVRMDAGDRPGALAVIRRSPPGPARDHATARLALRPLTEPSRRPSMRPPVDPRQAVEARLLSAVAGLSSRPTNAERHLRAAAEIAVDAGMLTALRGYPEPLTVLADLLATRPDAGAVAVLAAHARPASPAVHTPPPEAVRLSGGERHLLAVMANHRGHAELATALGVSVNTVKTRLRRLYRKLGVSDHASAVREARSRGLLTNTQ